MAREKTSAWKMFWGRARASSQLPRRNPSPRMFRRSRPRRIRAGFRHQASGVTGLDFRALAPEGFRPARVVRRGSKFVRAIVGLWSFAVGSDICSQWRTTNDERPRTFYSMSTTTVNISATQVKELREKTGAPMMDCKQALTEAKGDMEQAVVVLRKKGVSVAAKKATRVTSEGSVASYIHAGGKIGVLVEINCESDFVARTEDFKELVHDIAMH